MKSITGPKFQASFNKDYDIDYSKLIDKAFTTFETYPAFNKNMKTEFAIERIPKKSINNSKFLEGLETFGLSHPNLSQIQGWYNDDFYIYIIHDKFIDNNLDNLIRSVKLLNETVAAVITKQVLLVLNYLYNSQIAYVNLSPKYIIIPSKSDKSTRIKLVSIEWIKTVDECFKSQMKHEDLIFYKSPEEIEGNRTLLSPMWALGSIVNKMITGKVLFQGKTESEVKDKILKGKISLNKCIYDKKKDCEDFILKLMVPEASRMTPETALHHPWIVKNTKEFSKSEESISESVVSNLRGYSSIYSLKRMILCLLITTINEQEFSAATKAFTALDKNGDGKLSESEIKDGLINYFKGAKSEEEVTDLLVNADVDDNGYVDYREFCIAAIGNQLCNDEKRLTKAFTILNTDKKGYWSTSDFLEMLKPYYGKMTKNEIEDMIDDCDINKDGKITIKEAVTMMKA